MTQNALFRSLLAAANIAAVILLTACAPQGGVSRGPAKTGNAKSPTLSPDLRAALVLGETTPFHLLVTAEVPAKHESRFVYLANQAQNATRSEPGCLSYTFFRDAERTGVYHLFETWASAPALTTHLQQPYTVELITFANEVAKVDLRILRPLSPGDGNLDQLPAQLAPSPAVPVVVPPTVPAVEVVPVPPPASVEPTPQPAPVPAPSSEPKPDSKPAPKVVRPRP